MLSAWPADRDRLHGYAEKAMREAGDRTTWTAPDEDYEAAVHAAVDAAYDDTGSARSSPTSSTASRHRAGATRWPRSWSLTMPGVPDVYQGSELWEQSLVDPDNRRFVDFDHRADLLGALREGGTTTLSTAVDDPGAAKLQVTRAADPAPRPARAVRFVRRPDRLRSAADHVLAFDRGGAITVATRLPLGLAAKGGWGDTTLSLPDGEWRDEVSGRVIPGATDVPLATILADLPVALLVSTSSTTEETV